MFFLQFPLFVIATILFKAAAHHAYSPPIPKSPLISFYQVVEASFQSPLVGPSIDTQLAYNVISAYLIVW